MQLQESGEMYIETIYVLTSEKANVRSIDVSEHMGFSKPSVSRAIGLLKSGGYVNVDKDGYLSLTEAGLEVAKRMYSRHKLLSDLLISLGVPEEIATTDACKMEHHLSDESFAAIKKFVDERRI
ncbi:MAG: metal-dependent transcriptional regulator [Clostridia bacterium]|nr:metal-dependent transcriptional regulator [Clostridia bacterium]